MSSAERSAASVRRQVSSGSVALATERRLVVISRLMGGHCPLTPRQGCPAPAAEAPSRRLTDASGDPFLSSRWRGVSLFMILDLLSLFILLDVCAEVTKVMRCGLCYSN